MIWLQFIVAICTCVVIGVVEVMIILFLVFNAI